MPKRGSLAFAATAGTIIAVDQLTKAAVRASFSVGESVPVIDGVLWLTHVHNTGAAFGMLAGWGWAFVAVSVAVLAVIGWAALVARPESGVVRLGLALVAGGAAGNLIDRVLAGGVTDFIDVGWWPVFNVADIALDCGVALIVGWLLFGQARETSEDTAAAGSRGAGAAGTAPDDALSADTGASDNS